MSVAALPLAVAAGVDVIVQAWGVVCVYWWETGMDEEEEEPRGLCWFGRHRHCALLRNHFCW